MYTLYGHKGAGSTAIECALEAAHLPWRFVSAASWDAQSAQEELRQVNPLMQIPTLVLPDGTVLSESAAILIHLGLTCPDSVLLPADASQRARAIRGLVFVATNCYMAISISDFPERWLAQPTDEAKENLVKGTRARLHANWELFADTFTATPFLSGDKPGALDFLAAVVSRWSGARKHLQQTRPALAGVLADVEQHESVRAVFLRNF